MSIMVLILVSCTSRDESLNSLSYTDKKLSFYDASNENYSVNVWIRKTQNIRALHETLKKYGYRNIFSADDLASNPCIIWSYIKKPCGTLIDSLILTYVNADQAPTYYREFWTRRKAEQNDTTVYAVLKEVKEELSNTNPGSFNNNLANDTIYNLLRIKFKQPGSEKEALDNFNYLVDLKLYLSAYNLLFESMSYTGFSWDRDRLKKKLKPDSIGPSPYPIIPDNTK